MHRRFCATFLNASGNTSNATAVQRVTALEELVDALQDESAERSMALTDAVAPSGAVKGVGVLECFKRCLRVWCLRMF